MDTLKSKIFLEVRKPAYWAMLLDPAVPLAVYFCVSTMLPLLAKQFSIQHPAYFMFSWLVVCLIYANLRDAGRLITRTQPVDLIFIAFVLIILFSWFKTGLTGGYRVIAFVTTSMAIPWMVTRLFTPSQIGRFVCYTALFGSVVTLGYWIMISFMQDSDVIYERVTLFGEHAVYGVFGPTVGLLAVMSAAYLILPGAAHSQRLNGVAWVMLPISLVVIVQMGGRGMLMSALLALLASCIFMRQSSLKRKIAVMSVVLVSTIVGLVLVPETRVDHFSRLIGFAHNSPDRAVNDTITIRRECYREAVEIFLNKPVTGSGTGRYGLESSCLGESSALTTPHSTVFHVLSELGILGMVPFVMLNAMLLGIVWRVIRVQSSDPNLWMVYVVTAVWIYIVIYDQFSANYLTSLRYYLFSGLLVSLATASCASKRGTEPLKRNVNTCT